MRDARFFAGWMKDLTTVSARVTMKGNPSIEIGDKFLIECHGKERIAMFQGQVSNLGGEDIVVTLLGPITYRPTVENARVAVQGVMGTVNHDGLVIDIEVVDVSESGMGVVSSQNLPRGEHIDASLNTPCGDVHCSGEVRYSKPDTEQYGKFRIGIALDPLDRLAGARWKKLYDSAF